MKSAASQISLGERLSTRRRLLRWRLQAPALSPSRRSQAAAGLGQGQGGSPARLPHGRAGDRPAARGHRLPACVQPVELVPRGEPERSPGRAAGSGSTTTAEMFESSEWLDALLRTLAFAGISVAIETVLALGLALMLHRQFRGRGLLRVAVLIPWAVPTVVSATLWKTMFDPRAGLRRLHLRPAHHLARRHLDVVGRDLRRRRVEEHPVHRDDPARPACR